MDNTEDDSDVLSKADAFLTRRRAQLASAVIDRPAPAEPIDDIPVLTQVVDAEGIASPPKIDISHELDTWLDEHLPQAVAHAMDGITDKLILQIQQSAEKELLPRLKRALSGRDEHSKD
jgi:hypothetical protein